MKKRWVVPAIGLWLAACTAGQAFDTVKLKPKGTVVGEVVKISPLGVVVKQGAAVEKQVPVNQIDTIIYDTTTEPSSLNAARMVARRGRYQDALDVLNDPQKIDPAKIDRPEVKQDVAFFKALCTAKLALAGTGKISDAGSAMFNFVNNEAGSYHYLEAREVLGDLLVAAGKYTDAVESYSYLAKAPWPDYKMRANVAIGRAQLAENKLADAEKSFDTVLAIQAEGPLADFQRMAATLGKARCLAAKGQTDQAAKMVKDVIANADAEYGELHSRAYNTLGTIERKAGHTKAAILAFLHVEILYFTYPEQRAEALANLEQLWNEVHKPERARKARQELDTYFKNSRWAQQKGG
jgi:tetratricopeptide (TPR) repeat protein